MKKVNVYNNENGMITAIVMEDGKAANIIAGFEDGRISTAEFLDAAQGGFKFADAFEASDFGGLSLEEAAESIQNSDDLIAEITETVLTLHNQKMGLAAGRLFELEQTNGEH